MLKYYYGKSDEPFPVGSTLTYSQDLAPRFPAEIRSRDEHSLPCGT